MCGREGVRGGGGHAWQGVGMVGMGWCGCVHDMGGHVWFRGCVAGETATEAGGTHLTGMHSCIFKWVFVVSPPSKQYKTASSNVV